MVNQKMNLEITEKKENKLLARTEIVAQITFEGKVPSRENVRENLSNQLKQDQKLIIVRNIKIDYGQHKGTVKALVYEDENILKELENSKKKYIKKDAERAAKIAEEKAKAAEEKAKAKEESAKKEKAEETKKEAKE